MAYARGTAAPSSNPPSLSLVERKRRKRLCTHCLGEKEADQFKWCAVCRVAGALRSALYREDHKKRGLCIVCTETSEYNRSRHAKRVRCTHHLEYDNALHQARYAKRRAAGLCAYCKSESPDKYFCDPCALRWHGTKTRRPVQPMRKAA